MPHQSPATDHQSSQEMAVTYYALREETPMPVQEQPEPLELCEEEPLDPWTERAPLSILVDMGTAGCVGAGTAACAKRRRGPGDGASGAGVAQRC